MKKILLLLLTFNFLYSVEISDLLCGCGYCKTVNPSQPLDVGYHMSKCESWSKSARRSKEIEKETPEQPPKRYLSIVEKDGAPFLVDVVEVQEQNKKLETENKDLKDKVEKLEKRIQELEEFILELELNKKDIPIDGWVYDPEDFKWVYLSDKIYPYLYSQDLGWMKYEPGSQPKQFYIYKQQKWKTY